MGRERVPALNDKDIGTTKALTVRQLMAMHRASPMRIKPVMYAG